MTRFFQAIKKRLPSAILAIPISVFLFAIPVFWALMFWNGCDGLDANCWKRWDSSLYLDIANIGYTLVPCTNDANDWCGNAGWAPLYPLTIRAMAMVLGLSLENAGILLSHFAFLAALLVAARLAEIKDFSFKNWLSIVLFTVFPGCVYFLAIFPVSMVMLAYLMVFVGLKEEKFFLAGMGGAIAALSYSSGFFIAVPIFVFCVVRFFYDRKFDAMPTTVLPVILAIGAWFLYFNWKLGHWDALFLIQEKYGHGIYSPIKMLFTHLQKAYSQFHSPQSIIEIQTVFVFLLGLLLVLDILRKMQLGQRRPFQFFQLAFVIMLWFVPFSMGPNISLYRGCIFLAPFMLFQKDKPFVVGALQFALSVFFMILMSQYFFDKTLI